MSFFGDIFKPLRSLGRALAVKTESVLETADNTVRELAGDAARIDPVHSDASSSSEGRLPSGLAHLQALMTPHPAAHANSLDIERPLTPSDLNIVAADVEAHGFNVTALLAAIRDQESSGDYHVVNSAGAMGAYQFMPATAWAVLAKPYRLAQRFNGPDDARFQDWFTRNPGLQDIAAVHNLQGAIADGARSVPDIGAYWLAGPAGMRDRMLHDIRGRTASEHGERVLASYSEHVRGSRGTDVAGAPELSDGHPIAHALPATSHLDRVLGRSGSGSAAVVDLGHPLDAHDLSIAGSSIEQNGFDVEALLAAIRDKESSGNYAVVNSIGAIGAYQFMPATAWDILVGPYALAEHYLGPSDPQFQAWFRSNPGVQDLAAIGNIQAAIANGAQSVRDIGAYWLGGRGGMLAPYASSDVNFVTPAAHGEHIETAYREHVAQAHPQLADVIDPSGHQGWIDDLHHG